jgi:hypothetical protein
MTDMASSRSSGGTTTEQPRKRSARSATKSASGASPGTDPPTHVPGRAAAARVEREQHITVTLPFVGDVQLPPPGHLAFYGGVIALAALELVEWPVAVALAAGHALANQHHNTTIRQLGEALEEA